MSFHWNLSSEDEFDDEAQDHQETTSADFPEFSFQNEPTKASRSWPDDAATGVASLPIAGNQGDSFEDDDEVDWEDADHDDDDGRDVQAESPVPFQPLTIDMGSKPTKKRNRIRIRRRQVYKHNSLSLGMQRLLTNLHRTHLLSLLSRAVLISRSCSDHLLLHVALSLVPSQVMARIQSTDNIRNVPTTTHLRDFCAWFFDFIHNVEQRRGRQHAANVAAGAPRAKRQKVNPKATMKYGHGTTSSNDLLEVCDYMSPANDENPQLRDEDFAVTSQQQVQLLVTIARAIGWRARHVSVLDPMPCHLDMNHPLLLSGVGNVFKAVQAIHDQDKKQPAKRKQEAAQSEDEPLDPQLDSDSSFVWAEILCQPSKAGKIANKYRWIHLDPVHQLIDRPRHVESFFHVRKFGGIATEKKRRTIGFALAVEHLPADTVYGGTYNLARLTDVTRRYVNSWSKSLRLREDGTIKDRISWWDDTIDRINYDARYQATWVCGDVFGPSRYSAANSSANGLSKTEAIQVEESSDDGYDRDADEQEELMEAASQETMPTSKAGFKNHPLYVLESQLGVAEVLAPEAKKRFRGIFKGELVFSRSEASTAMVAKKWMYEGRKVKDEEMGKPIKRIKARKRPTKMGFQALDTYGVGQANDGSEEARQKEMAKAECEEKEDDGMLDLYAIWQTTPWSPDPVGPDDEIPVNEYGNVELALINPGLFHLEAPRMSVVAKNLGIPYAPCLLGFEGHGGNRTPTIRGIVVHEHNAELLTEAYAEFESQVLEQEYQVRQTTILRRWKKLITGLLIKAHVDREYGDDDEEEEAE
jgi:Rad4 beta-hairpin domain 3/Rad4 beta-hairpin domain 2/Rad4 beta-hairpin domain 1